jgi:type II secretory pathway pseudopilin PulG
VRPYNRGLSSEPAADFQPIQPLGVCRTARMTPSPYPVLRRAQGGFLLIAAVIIIAVVGSMAAAMVTLTSGSGQAGGEKLKATQALYLAESGLEYQQRRLAQNVDWYRASTDPFDLSTQNVGPGSFSTSVNLPATLVRTRMTAGASTANVFCGGTTNRWQTSGTLLLDGDFSGQAEFVTYSSTNATSFTITARNAAVNTVRNFSAPAGTGFVQERGTNVYPVATVSGASVPLPIAANCTALANLQLAANSKFLAVGTITVFHNNAGTVVSEQMTYSDASTVSGTTTLRSVQRCQNGTSAVVVAAGNPVAPLVQGLGVSASAPDFEAQINVTGSVENGRRMLTKLVRR